jgi:hypothetical protein
MWIHQLNTFVADRNASRGKGGHNYSSGWVGRVGAERMEESVDGLVWLDGCGDVVDVRGSVTDRRMVMLPRLSADERN